MCANGRRLIAAYSFFYFIQGEGEIDYIQDIGSMDELLNVEAIGADLVDNSELDRYLRQYPSTSSSPWVDTEPYNHHAKYHELQPNTTIKPNFSVCQTSYQPSYQYVINNFN